MMVSGGMSIGDGCGVERENVVKKKVSKLGYWWVMKGDERK